MSILNLVEFGVENVKPLMTDGTDFNTDVYCSHCGYNLTDFTADKPRIFKCPYCGGYVDKEEVNHG